MNEEQQDTLFDLLMQKAVYGLDEAGHVELEAYDPAMADAEFNSLELTAAAISIAGLSDEEPLPSHLYSKIEADAQRYVLQPQTELPWPPPPKTVASYDARSSSRSWFGWLGWAAAAAACIALAINIGLTRFQRVEVAQVPPTVEAPKALTPAEMRDEMMRSTANMTKANWAPGNVKDMKQVTGDVVWSDEKQAGYMRFRGLPVNDANKETYQLWIFDKTQDKATPIDGGTFDVNSDGEVVVPINAKLKAHGPEMFAITVEKPGGVVVSKREKIAALAKVETQAG